MPITRNRDESMLESTQKGQDTHGEINLRSFTLAELLGNPHVAQLHQDYQEANRRAMKAMDYAEENVKLKEELLAYKIQRATLGHQSQVSMSGTANIPFLGPSHESASVFSRIGNSTIRPFQYPESVLWTLQDCKKNEDVNLSKSNPSRPSMRFGIR
ncbi:hypothetical protein JOM56_014413 [Amanita muscaria]